MVEDIIKRLENDMNTYSKGQKLIARYIIDHYEKAVYMTAAKLGEVVGVSESTVVRFAVELGFDGYPKFQKAFQELVRTKLNALQRMEVAYGRIDKQNVLKNVLQTDMENIRTSLENIDIDAFNKSVEAIMNSENIYILGVRSCLALASFMACYLNYIFPNVKQINTTSVSETFEQVVRISDKDVIIGISYPRYSKRTIKALEYAKSKNAKVIALTDTPYSPIAQVADHVLTSRSDMVSFVDSLVAPLSVINALIAALGMEKKAEVLTSFENLEKIWEEYDVYEKYDLD